MAPNYVARTRARHEIGEIAHQLVKLLLGNVMDRRRHESTTSQRNRNADVHLLRRLKFFAAPKPVELTTAQCATDVCHHAIEELFSPRADPL